MSALSSTKPQAWTLSPQMTAAPELWRGCVRMLAWSLTHDIARGDFWTIVDTTSEVETGLSDMGRVFEFRPTSADSGGALSVSTVGSVDLGAGPWSIWGISRVRVLPSSRSSPKDSNVISWHVGTADENNAPYYNDDDSMSLWDNGSRVEMLSSITAGTWYNHVVTYDGTNTLAYVDGEEKVNTTSLNFDSLSSDFYIGRRGGSGDRYFDGDLAIFGLFNRVLTANEAERLNTDPFAMLRPAGF
jgi:hypothetical protein